MQSSHKATPDTALCLSVLDAEHIHISRLKVGANGASTQANPRNADWRPGYAQRVQKRASWIENQTLCKS